MNIDAHQSDNLIREVFKNIPTENPSANFTSKVMDRIEKVNIEQTSIYSNFNLGFRTLLALALTVGFFALLIVTSDFSFMDSLSQMIYQLKFHFNELMQSFGFLSSTNNLSLIIGIVLLSGGALMVFSHGVNKKSHSSNLGFF